MDPETAQPLNQNFSTQASPPLHKKRGLSKKTLIIIISIASFVLLIIILALVLYLCLSEDDAPEKPKFSGGKGTKADPFHLSTCSDLTQIHKVLDHHFLLKNSITCSEALDSQTPSRKGFSGSLNGDSHTLDLLLSGPLFSYTNNGALIQNLNLHFRMTENTLIASLIFKAWDTEVINCAVQGKFVSKSSGEDRQNAGGMIAESENVVIKNCTANVQIDLGLGYEAVGGLVGMLRGVVQDSSVSAVVTSKGERVGGLAGYCDGEKSSVEKNTVQGTVKGEGDLVGGVIGYALDLQMVQNTFSGTVMGGTFVGGIAGDVNNAFVQRNHAKATVEATGQSVGGAFGSTRDSQIIQCTSSGAVSSNYESNSIGGLIGTSVSSEILQSFANSQVKGTGAGTIGGLIGSTNIYLKSDISKVENCYARGKVQTTSDERCSLGGLIGSNAKTTVKDCYAANNINSHCPTTGGLIGADYDAETENSFWDIDTSEIESSSTGGIGLRTEEMQTPSNFSKWSEKIWYLTKGEYPELILESFI